MHKAYANPGAGRAKVNAASAERLGTGCGPVRSSAPEVVAVVGLLLGADQLVVEEPGPLAALVEAEAEGLVVHRLGERPPRSRRGGLGPPAPVSAEIGRTRGVRAAICAQRLGLARAAAGRSCSRPRSSGPARPRRCPSSARMARTFSAWISLSGWAMSRTCRIRSASSTSSSVARKAATSWVGRSEMKPTVSERIAARPSGQRDRPHGRVERGEEHVLGQHPGAGQPVEQRRLAGVGVADQRHDRIRHPLRAPRGAGRGCAPPWRAPA